MIPVGTPVQSITDNFLGIVTAHKGAAEGQIACEVTTVEVPLNRSRIYRDEDLATYAATPTPYAVGSKVRCYGQDAEIITYNADDDTYELVSMVTLPSGSIVVRHWYPAVPAWHIWLWHGNDAVPSEPPA
ncbi:hypothetical protein GCM10010869_16540 [Mesorhizobium tianshanense]|uniref:Uncharacterized protein n=1 Tax=Mesorhizobium tianshanense TaxID=39844 RepID=A0A562NW42_9HYPH|nr:hypothetical protein [Mesorhizobium tianshanense]TWI36395.1 hypothetical protein IQ26_02908 [Mesorhizobium tianshanense]GLS36065.1 hypothetical protein GCM10010869_16540 [Mesorhizobium tianshanense]